MASLSHIKPIWGLAGLGIISGLLSSYTLELTEEIKILDVPILPGVLFGVAIGIGLHNWGKSGWAGAFLALVMTIASWIAAVRGFQFVTNEGKEFLYLGALAAGVIGAAGTQLGGALTVDALRRPTLAIVTIVVGAIAGLLVIYPLEYQTDAWIVLFVPWQALVAAAIGYALNETYV